MCVLISWNRRLVVTHNDQNYESPKQTHLPASTWQQGQVAASVSHSRVWLDLFKLIALIWLVDWVKDVYTQNHQTHTHKQILHFESIFCLCMVRLRADCDCEQTSSVFRKDHRRMLLADGKLQKEVCKCRVAWQLQNFYLWNAASLWHKRRNV